MPATRDENGYLVLNQPTQAEFDRIFRTLSLDPGPYRSRVERFRLTIEQLRNDGWNDQLFHLRFMDAPLTDWGIDASLLGVDTDTIVTAPQRKEPVDISDETLCYCESCKQKRYEPNSLAFRRMHNYSYAPARWIMRSVDGDKFPYHMGVELETTASARDHLDNGYAVDMRRPKQFWLAKRDGSVSGPEFCSHPATLTWWHENESELRDMFKMLIHAGFTSHNGAQAGMHVNISRQAFGSADHLGRFLRLVTMRPDWSITMAQRSYDRAQQWARLIQYNDATVQAAFSGQTRYLTDKYSVVNILRNRYEFRLPRGTLRIDRFMKNLEWAAAMIGFTRTVEDVSDINPDNFMTWVRNFPLVYGFLNSFIEEKRTALVEATSLNSAINSRWNGNLPA